MKLWVAVLFVMSALPAYSQTESFRIKQFNLDDGLAIKGYDPIAYFKLNKAVKGKKDFSFSWQGVGYHFISEADLEKFKANPAKYEPQFGGWCAYAMGHDGSKV